MSEYSLEVIRDLVNRKLPWYVLKEMMSAPKDKDRFDKYIKVLQEKVPWKERILLPIHEHLYIVEKNGEAIVKAKCGYEFGDYRENWLLKTLIYVRDTPEKFREVYPILATHEPKLQELREHICPGCGAMLHVYGINPGGMVNFLFLPDLGSFYKDWLGKPIPGVKDQSKGVQDKTIEMIKKWVQEEKK